MKLTSTSTQIVGENKILITLELNENQSAFGMSEAAGIEMMPVSGEGSDFDLDSLDQGVFMRKVEGDQLVTRWIPDNPNDSVQIYTSPDTVGDLLEWRALLNDPEANIDVNAGTCILRIENGFESAVAVWISNSGGDVASYALQQRNAGPTNSPEDFKNCVSNETNAGESPLRAVSACASQIFQ